MELCGSERSAPCHVLHHYWPRAGPFIFKATSHDNEAVSSLKTKSSVDQLEGLQPMTAIPTSMYYTYSYTLALMKTSTFF